MSFSTCALKFTIFFTLFNFFFLLLFVQQTQHSVDWSIAYRYFSSSSLVPSATTYVVSLPRRTDRRQQMEILRSSLGVTWSYHDAADSQSDTVRAILANVKISRNHAIIHHNESVPGGLNMSQPIDLPFEWANHLDLAVTESPNLQLAIQPREPVTCATKNNTIIPYTNATPSYLLLTPPRVACWLSHLQVVEQIAKQDETNAVGIILEDDIDMEKDIKKRLSKIWPYLPDEWDMLFLGHCWSNESFYPPIGVQSFYTTMHLHPSFSPKCTHAYALSPKGARRLYRHLTYPPFAYSRALDQAYAWLIQSKRLQSYSIVPSVVVQRKIGGSDIAEGLGNIWKEELQDGIFTDSNLNSDPWML